MGVSGSHSDRGIRTMLSKSLMQFSVMDVAVFLSLPVFWPDA